MQDKIEYFSVNNWDKFQHYKDRNPPWIRLYTALLDDYKFQKLAKNNQRVLILLWLVAAKTGNEIPFDIPYLERFIPGITKENVIELSHLGLPRGATSRSMPRTPSELSAEFRPNSTVPWRRAKRWFC